MPKGELILCGLSIGNPFDASLRTLAVLKRADIIFFHDPTPEGLASVRGLGCKVVALPGKNNLYWTELKRELGRGRRVAYLCFGHPLMFNGGLSLAQRAARKGFAVSVIPCTTASDHVLALLWRYPEWFANGYLIREAGRIAQGKDSFISSVTTIVYTPHRLAAKGKFNAFCARLRRAYPPNHRLYAVQCANGGDPDLIEAVKIKDAQSLADKLTPPMSLVIPARPQSS